ncbi:MAG: ATP-binding cassette domain-containing protein [Shimia sp.]
MMDEISQPDLEVTSLQVADPAGRMLLDVESLTVTAGTSLGIRGPSGAGKSTLLFALAGLAERASGRVAWGGTDLIALRPSHRAAWRAAHVGMVFQDFLLFDEMGAGANAAIAAGFAPRAARGGIRARAARELADLGIAEPARGAATHSGGERQRIAVARALAADAPILLADEPTAALQRPAADALAGDLVARCRDGGRTLIVASHDEALLAALDRVIDLRDGRLAGGGR